MYHWVPYPFVRITCVFIAGIAVGIFFPGIVPVYFATLLLAFLILIFGLLFLFRNKISAIASWSGITGLSIIFLMGYIHLFYKTESNHPNHILHFPADTLTHYTAIVISQPQEKENSWKTEVRMQLKHVNKTWKRGEAHLLLYLSKRDFPQPFHYGDQLLIRGNPQRVSPPSNPNTFNYQQYVSFQGIYHQQYLQKNECVLIGSAPASMIMKWAIYVNIWARTTLQKYISGNQEQAIALGLILGVKDQLDIELRNAYAASGGMHVLAVSGLHVGIIYWIVLLVLRPLGKTSAGKVITALIGIGVLWSYALITGMSPSVLRAVTMFTFVALAAPWKQRGNIYNTLALSACCLLLYNPYLIMAAGFQLSYSAVLGIVYFQPLIYRVFTSRYFVVNKIWELTSVTCAAQLATGVLGLFYFHQFPVYFWLSNLIIIPCAFLILTGGLAILVFSGMSTIALPLGYMVQCVIAFLNHVVYGVQTFPYSLLTGIYLTGTQCFLIFLIILSLIAFFELKRMYYFIVAFLVTVGYGSDQVLLLRKNQAVRKLVVYDIPRHSAFDIIAYGTVYSFQDSLLTADTSTVEYQIQPNRLASYANRVVHGDSVDFKRISKGCMAIMRQGISILWITEKDPLLPVDVAFDCIILSNNGGIAFDKEWMQHTRIIIDGSNSSNHSKAVISQANERGLRVYYTRTRGAYVWIKD